MTDNKLQQIPTARRKLYKPHLRAIELRFEGKTYEEISKILSGEGIGTHLNQKIRTWFMRGGICDLAFLEYSRIENDRRRQEVMEQMKSVIQIVPVKIIELLNRVSVNPFTGEALVGPDGKPMPKLDKLTVATLGLVMTALGMKVPANTDTGGDPLEEWREIVKEEIAKEKSDAK